MPNTDLKIKRILFPIDFSDRSRATAPFVLSMARRFDADVVLLHAFEPPPPVYSGMVAVYPEVYDFEGLRADLLPKVAAFAERELPKVRVETVVEIGPPALVITEYAGKHAIDLIALPTHGYGPFRRALLGSVTAKVLHDSKVAVWTDAHAPESAHRAHPEPRHILVALDLKPESRRVLDIALAIAKRTGANVEILHAASEAQMSPMVPAGELEQVLADAARDQLVELQREAGTNFEATVDTGEVSQLIRSMALKQRSDLVVIGRGAIQGGFSRFMANDYSIVREAPCPVLSV